jgi:hypothetical protein
MTFRTAALIGLAALSASWCAAARADDCAPVRAATLAGISRPYAATIKMPGPDGLPLTSHVVMTGDKMYLQIRRTWTTKLITSKELVDKANKSALKELISCQRAGAEEIGGDASTIYAVDSQMPGHIGHSRVWISNASGLPLKTEVTLPGGESMTSLFDYKNVAPPPGEK